MIGGRKQNWSIGRPATASRLSAETRRVGDPAFNVWQTDSRFVTAARYGETQCSAADRWVWCIACSRRMRPTGPDFYRCGQQGWDCLGFCAGPIMAPALHVFTVATGAERVWGGPGVGPGFGPGAVHGSLSWTADGRTLALIRSGGPPDSGARRL